MRPSKRAPDELRPVTLQRGVARYAEGSCLVSFGETKVLCAASLEERGPPWLRGSGKGWVTAEYAMLPRATHERTRREVTSGKPSGRTQEIQRLIGRSLRSCVDMAAMGEWTITIDCDVLQADGGTRTASITGGAVALYDACAWIAAKGTASPFREFVAAMSAGVVGGALLLDLDYTEDSAAEVDLNLVMRESGGIIEVQGTGERSDFSPEQLAGLVALTGSGIRGLLRAQREAVGG
jgi:ribonuclease PH